MPHLNAFVGHSFAADDESVVNRLLVVLNSVKNVMPEFDWDRAEAAEPKALSAKVREKMKGKNLFIGICTAREQTVHTVRSPGLRASWLVPKTQLVVERASIETKTTDWIIQEIGFAIGNDMDLILLLEEGVRPPGGLQGDLEYIPFNRSEPEKCVKKLSSMLGALSPKPMPASEAPEKPATDESTDQRGLGDLFLQTYLSPAPSWTADTYVRRLRFAIRLEEPSSQTEIENAFRASPFYQDEGARVAFEAGRISERADVYKEDWITPLERLAQEHPAQVGSYLALAERFSAAGEHDGSALKYELAAQRSDRPRKTIEFMSMAAEQRAFANQAEAAERLLQRASELLRASPECEADGLAQMSTVWKALGKDELFLACAERCLELAPDRPDPRFSLAYKYSELNSNAEALFHYRRYLDVKDDPAGWNNLGASASTLKLPVTAVDGYQRADKAGNTLATSNLAFAKLEAGFADEAIELCEQGLKAEQPNPRLFDALAKGKRAQEDEAAKEDELLKATNIRREMLRATGRASLLATPDRLPATWRGELCQLAVTLDGANIVMTGTYERKAGGYGNLTNLMGGLFTDNRTETVTVEYVGRLYGEAFVGKVKTTAPSTLSGLLSLAGEGINCVGYFYSNRTQLVVLEGKNNRYVLSALVGR